MYICKYQTHHHLESTVIPVKNLSYTLLTCFLSELINFYILHLFLCLRVLKSTLFLLMLVTDNTILLDSDMCLWAMQIFWTDNKRVENILLLNTRLTQPDRSETIIISYTHCHKKHWRSSRFLTHHFDMGHRTGNGRAGENLVKPQSSESAEETTSMSF